MSEMSERMEMVNDEKNKLRKENEKLKKAVEMNKQVYTIWQKWIIQHKKALKTTEEAVDEYCKSSCGYQGEKCNNKCRFKQAKRQIDALNKKDIECPKCGLKESLRYFLGCNERLPVSGLFMCPCGCTFSRTQD